MLPTSGRLGTITEAGEESLMRKTEPCVLWVVYRMTLHRKPSVPAVCEQGEWEAMERAQPGRHTLVQASIGSEVEAEKLARSAPADGSTIKPAGLKLPLRH